MYTIYRTGCCKKGDNPLELVAVKGEKPTNIKINKVETQNVALCSPFNCIFCTLIVVIIYSK